MPASTRIHGPYPEGARFRLVVIEGAARKSVKCNTQEEALALKAELLAQLSSQSSRRVEETLEEFLAALGRERGSKEITVRKYRQRLQLFLPVALPLSSLTPQRAAALYRTASERTLRGRPVAAATHRSALKAAQLFGRWCQRRGYLRENPFATVTPVGRVHAGKPQLSLDEARRLVMAAQNGAKVGDAQALMVLLLLLLGLRSSEVSERRVADLDDEGRVLWIPHGKTQNARRRLAVPELLQPLLRKLTSGRLPADPLFGATSKNTIARAVSRYCSLAGVSQVCPHSLRGLHATLAITAGATSHAVAAALGHGSFAVTARHYVDPNAITSVRVRTVLDVLTPSDSGSIVVSPPPPPHQEPGAVQSLLDRMTPEQRAELRQLLLRKDC